MACADVLLINARQSLSGNSDVVAEFQVFSVTHYRDRSVQITGCYGARPSSVSSAGIPVVMLLVRPQDVKRRSKPFPAGSNVSGLQAALRALVLGVQQEVITCQHYGRSAARRSRCQCREAAQA